MKECTFPRSHTPGWVWKVHLLLAGFPDADHGVLAASAQNDAIRMKLCSGDAALLCLRVFDLRPNRTTPVCGSGGVAIRCLHIFDRTPIGRTPDGSTPSGSTSVDRTPSDRTHGGDRKMAARHTTMLHLHSLAADLQLMDRSATGATTNRQLLLGTQTDRAPVWIVLSCHLSVHSATPAWRATSCQPTLYWHHKHASKKERGAP